MIDPLSEAVQIVGRFRKSEGLESTKEVVHITNFMPELTSESKDEVLSNINERRVGYKLLQRLLAASTTRGAVSTFKEALERVEFARYINPDGTYNYFMQDNAVFVEMVKGFYQSMDNLLAGYKKSGHFIVVPEDEKYEITDRERVLKQSSTPLKTVYSVIMPMLKDIYDPEITSIPQREFQMVYLRKEYKKVVQDFDRLGYEAVKALEFNPKKIKLAIREKDRLEQVTNFGLLQHIEEAFKEGELCSSQTIVSRLKQGLIEYKLPLLKPNLKLLRNYCKLSDRMWIGTVTNKDVMGYQILKIYHKLRR